jgi:hypothetical protein
MKYEYGTGGMILTVEKFVLDPLNLPQIPCVLALNQTWVSVVES